MEARADAGESPRLFTLPYDRRTWVAYGALLLLLSWFYFGRVFVGLAVLGLLAAVGAHAASLVALPFCLYWSHREGTPLGGKLGWLIACSLLGLALVAAVLVMASTETTTWAAIVGLGTTSYLAFDEAEALSTYSSARGYLANGDIPTGSQLLRQALEQSDDDALRQELFFRLAVVLPVLGEASLPLLQRAVAEYPDDFWLNATLAAIEQEDPQLRRQGRRRMQLVREQAGYLSDDLDFNLAAVYHNLGEGYAKKGDYPDAIRTFEEALALSPGKESSRLALSKVYFNRGRKLERRGLQGEANQAYRRSLELDPQRAKAQRALHLLGTRTGC